MANHIKQECCCSHLAQAMAPKKTSLKQRVAQSASSSHGAATGSSNHGAVVEAASSSHEGPGHEAPALPNTYPVIPQCSPCFYAFKLHRNPFAPRAHKCPGVWAKRPAMAPAETAAGDWRSGPGARWAHVRPPQGEVGPGQVEQQRHPRTCCSVWGGQRPQVAQGAQDRGNQGFKNEGQPIQKQVACCTEASCSILLSTQTRSILLSTQTCCTEASFSRLWLLVNNNSTGFVDLNWRQ